MELTPEVFKENGFIEDGSGIYYPLYDYIKFHQLFDPNGEEPKDLINYYIVTIKGQLQVNSPDAVEVDTLEQVKGLYAYLKLPIIWK